MCRYSFGVRQYLKELGSIFPQKYKIHENHSPEYWNELGESLFSLCPSGWSPWSPRLFDSIMTGSIPIIFADDTQLPFEYWIPYRDFSVKIYNKDVGDLDRILKKFISLSSSTSGTSPLSASTSSLMPSFWVFPLFPFFGLFSFSWNFNLAAWKFSLKDGWTRMRFGENINNEDAKKSKEVASGSDYHNWMVQKRLLMMKYRHHFVWNENPVEGDAFYMSILELDRKRRVRFIGNEAFPSASVSFPSTFRSVSRSNDVFSQTRNR